MITEQSMSPALNPGDRLLARRARRPHRNRICFFVHPHRHVMWLAKRVIGVSGDTVTVSRDEVHVNGRILAEPWAHGDNLVEGRWDVPPGHVFVLSDSRELTRADSRSFGPIPWTGCYLAWFRYRRGAA